MFPILVVLVQSLDSVGIEALDQFSNWFLSQDWILDLGLYEPGEVSIATHLVVSSGRSDRAWW